MANKIIDQLDPAWKAHFEHEFSQDYMVKLREFLKSEMKGGAVIYP